MKRGASGKSYSTTTTVPLARSPAVQAKRILILRRVWRLLFFCMDRLVVRVTTWPLALLLPRPTTTLCVATHHTPHTSHTSVHEKNHKTLLPVLVFICIGRSSLRPGGAALHSSSTVNEFLPLVSPDVVAILHDTIGENLAADADRKRRKVSSWPTGPGDDSERYL